MQISRSMLISNQSGQMLVVVLLVLVVGLTIGLFLLGRTTTDVSLTTKISDSSRAFNAAEAGIEEALRDITAITPGAPVQVAPDTEYVVETPQDLGGSDSIYPESIQPTIQVGDTFTVWLVPHDDATGDLQISRYYYQRWMDVCFTQNSPTPAIGVTVFYRENGTNFRSSYSGYDPISRGNGLNSTTGVGACGGEGYAYRARVDFRNDFVTNLTDSDIEMISLRLRPLYQSTSIAVIPRGGAGGTLPKQGSSIASSGTVGETTRRINVRDPYRVPAPFMDMVLYSANDAQDISK